MEKPQSGAKAGIAPGATPNTTELKGGKRPVEEEDTFGGVERVHRGKDVKSGNAKP